MCGSHKSLRVALLTTTPLLLGVLITGTAQKKTVDIIFALKIASIAGRAFGSSWLLPFPLAGLHSLEMRL